MGTVRPVPGLCIQSEKNTHDDGQRAYHQQFVPGDIAFFFIQIILNRFFDLRKLCHDFSPLCFHNADAGTILPSRFVLHAVNGIGLLIVPFFEIKIGILHFLLRNRPGNETPGRDRAVEHTVTDAFDLAGFTHGCVANLVI